MNLLTAAHRTLPLPVYVRVTNLENNRRLVVRVNDRGPFAKDRILDLSKQAARELGFFRKGTARVEVRYVGRARTAAASKPPPARRRLLRPASAPVRLAGRIEVQVAAFERLETARETLDALASLGEGRIVRRKTKHVVIFGPFPDRLSAEGARSVMRARGFRDARILGGKS